MQRSFLSNIFLITKALKRAICLCLSAFYLFSSSAFAESNPTEAQLNQASQTRYWHLLLHYKKTLFGSYKSEADGEDFFLSPEGKTNPLSELKAALNAFSHASITVGPLKQPAQCAFPERYRYLNQTLNLHIDKIPCPDFDHWISQLAPVGATLIYASEYFNNPASMFGHTFLKIHSKHQSKSKEILNYGVNYAAQTNDDGGIKFMVLGLTGGYRGYFSLLPYFRKINEYQNIENRNLWEYKLNLNAEEVDRMTRHLWELGATWFSYYFFDENCSYHLLSLIEVARPELHLSDQFLYQVIPTDTVRLIADQPSLVDGVNFRPSLEKRMLAKLSQLSGPEKTVFMSYKNSDRKKIESNASIALLDALIDFEDMRSYENQDDRSDLQALLRLRAQKVGEAPTPVILEPSRPESGVKSSKVASYHAYRKNGSRTGLEIRTAYHDLLDQDAGYVPHSEISLFKTRLAFDWKDSKVILDEIEFLSIASLVPMTEFRKSISWKLSAGLSRTESMRNPQQSLALNLEGGAGSAVELSSKAMAALFLTAHIFDPALSLDGSFIFSSNRIHKALLSESLKVYAKEKENVRIESYLTLGNSFLIGRQWELRIYNQWVSSRQGDFGVHSAQLSHYF